MNRSFARLGLVVLGAIVVVSIMWVVQFWQRLVSYAETPVCQSNLKQLAVAIYMYADDHDGILPLKSSWARSTLPYYRNKLFLLCPQGSNREVGYAMNTAVSGRRLKGLPDAERTALFYDAKYGRPSYPHNGGCNVAFADGQVKWLSRDDVERLGIGR